MMIVTHEIRFAGEVADRVIFMDDGLIVEQGPPEAILRRPAEERTRAFLRKIIERARTTERADRAASRPSRSASPTGTPRSARACAAAASPASSSGSRPTPASSAGARAAWAPMRARSRRRSRPWRPSSSAAIPGTREAIARDVFRTGLWDYRATTGNFAFAGIDMALWDLCGKACGQPLHRLFGGPMRPSRGLLLLPRPGHARGDSGARPGRRRARLRLLLPQGRPRRARRRGDAGRPARRDRARGQDPRRRQRGLVGARGRPAPDPLARARSASTSPRRPCRSSRSTSCATSAPARRWRSAPTRAWVRQADALRVIESGVADVVCFSSYWVGTLRRFHTLSHLAHLRGQRVCKHTHGELGIAAAAAHHLMLTLPNATDGAQQTAAIMADDILTEPLPIAHGPALGPGRGAGARGRGRRGQARPLPRRLPPATASSCPGRPDEEETLEAGRRHRTAARPRRPHRVGGDRGRRPLHRPDADARRTARSRPATSRPGRAHLRQSGADAGRPRAARSRTSPRSWST